MNFTDQLGSDVENYQTGSEVSIKLEDPDLNIDPLTIDSTTVLVTSTRENIGESIILIETNPDSGIFAGNIATNENPVPIEENNLLEVNIFDRLIVYYHDPANELGLPQDLKDNAIYGATEVSGGERTEDILWSKANSPYLVTGDVTVKEGFALTIEPGVTVMFLANSDDQGDTSSGQSFNASELIIYGQLDAVGTEAEPIIFTSSAQEPFKGDWGGIYLKTPCCQSLSTLLQQIVVDYSGYGIWTEGYRHLTITNSVISNSSNHGIYVNNIDKGQGSITVSGSALRHNAGSGISILFNYSNSLIVNNDIYENNEAGLNYLYSSGELVVSGNNFSQNGAGGIITNHISSSDSPLIENNTITANGIGNGYGIKLYHNKDSYSCDTRYRIEGNTVSNGYYGLYISGKVIADIIDNVISANEYGLSVDFADVNADGTFAISGNQITNNSKHGIFLNSYAKPVIRFNDIYGNGASSSDLITYYAIYNNTTFDISAHYNWWGETNTREITSGDNPKDLSFIFDIYDSNSRGMVIYWALAASAMGDSDNDGLLDALEEIGCTDPENPDSDNDTLLDGLEDENHDGIVNGQETDPCKSDSDGDLYQDNIDIFPTDPQEWIDSDNDGTGDNSDPCPFEAANNDIDGDLICGNDNCEYTFNPEQKDCDNDGTGDKCDLNSPCSEDRDYDGIFDDVDNCLDDGYPNFPSAVLDDFEPESARLEWMTSGDGDWEISSDNPLLGNFSMSSPDLNDGESADLKLIKHCDTGVIGFIHRVDTEEDYDFLQFYIDDELQGEWSGSTGYTSSSAGSYTSAIYPVLFGLHSFKWTFNKDESLAAGQDKVWIDNVFFGPGTPTWPDIDNDFIPDIFDNCPEIVNSPQSDLDHDKIGDICETDNIGFFDSFESGDFSNFPWVTGGDGDWFVTSEATWYQYAGSWIFSSPAFEGQYAARTPWLYDNQQARLSLKAFTNEGEMSFRYRVDSEQDHDFLAFYIDDELQQTWSGAQGYTLSNSFYYTASSSSWYTFSSSASYTASGGHPFTSQVSAGLHTFKWVYEKDGANAAGTDAAWIDNVILPYDPVVEIPGYNPDQSDSDNDGFGDVCDVCPLDAENDLDDDGVCGDVDLCPGTMPGEQVDEYGCSLSQNDIDQDGMNNYWEIDNGLDPAANDALDDLDGDGFTNLHEFLGSSNPDDINELPELIADSDYDDDIDGEDLMHFSNELGKMDCSLVNFCFFDLNRDSVVDDIDLFLFTQDFGRRHISLPPPPSGLEPPM
ncbi:MAG: right-handed parallel beta-helix repeat-containing protein [Desulfobulbaceae bacterium]|nr:right-handed parallel beta-helix repeat-containing protein [Desulfobulbaceae bacterium]